MDVLIYQPRNAGSSTSLTTSCAYGNHKFSHPPSTYNIFHSGFNVNLFLSLTINFEIHHQFGFGDRGLTSFSFTSSLSDHQWCIDSSFQFSWYCPAFASNSLSNSWSLRVVARPNGHLQYFLALGITHSAISHVFGCCFLYSPLVIYIGLSISLNS